MTKTLFFTSEAPLKGFESDNLRKWAEFNPDYKVVLHNDADNLNLIKRYYPEFLKQYEAFEYNIQRADFARYAYLHQFGGIYADTDLEPKKSIAGLHLEDEEFCTLPVEPIPNGLGNRFLVTNFFMHAPKGADFMYKAMQYSVISRPANADKRITVLQTTGCIMLTELARDYYVHLLDSSQFTPKLHELNNAYGVHHYESSWW